MCVISTSAEVPKIVKSSATVITELAPTGSLSGISTLSSLLYVVV
ncbi:hypothetical protein ACOBV9_18685 (plasmid) [Pseudoalteromonas espejiana]